MRRNVIMPEIQTMDFLQEINDQGVQMDGTKSGHGATLKRGVTMPGMRGYHKTEWGVTMHRCIHPGQKGSLMYQNRGLVYRVLDQAGNKIGTPIKASQFYNKPTLKNLEVKFQQNESLREPFARRIKTSIDFAILQKNTLEHLSNELKKENISVVVRQNNDGRIYGMTFIDFKNRCVFNGSDLGRQYSAKAIQERCTIKPEMLKHELPSLNQKVNSSNKGSLENEIDLSLEKEHSVIFQKNHRFELLETLLRPQMNQESMPYELLKEHRLRQKKKKKKGLHL